MTNKIFALIPDWENQTIQFTTSDENLISDLQNSFSNKEDIYIRDLKFIDCKSLTLNIDFNGSATAKMCYKKSQGFKDTPKIHILKKGDCYKGFEVHEERDMVVVACEGFDVNPRLTTQGARKSWDWHREDGWEEIK